MYSYPITLTPDDGTFLVTCPALPEVTTFGENEADAIKHALDAIEEALAARIKRNQDIPTAAKKGRHLVQLSLLTTLKVALYQSLKEENVTRAELSRRLGWKREQVDRLFRLDHMSRLDQIEDAFAAMGETVELSVRRVA